MLKIASLDWLQTLADGTRVRLLRILESEELSVSEMCTVVQMPQSTVSRHLKVLAADGWIAHRRDGTNHLYRLAAEQWELAKKELWRWVRQQADTPTTDLDQQRLMSLIAQRSQGEQFFQSAASRWDKLRTDLFGQKLDAQVLAASLNPDAVVGEFGCGSAALSQLVSPFVKQVVAIDNSSAMLQAARQRCRELTNVKIIDAALTDLPLEDKTLNCVWMVVVLPYLSDPQAAFAEAARVMAPQARLVIVDLLPHDRDGYRQEMGHLRLGVERSELEGWLSGAGLRLTLHAPLPPDAAAKGPALFSAVGEKIQQAI